MMDGPSSALVLSAGSAGLLMLRAVVAALESALVAVGLPRAQALLAGGASPARARALATLLADKEPTAGLLRLLDTLTAVAAGFLAGLAGWRSLPSAPLFGAACAVLVAVLASLVLSAAARALGAQHGEAIALSLAGLARGLATGAAPIGRAAAWIARPLAGGPGMFTLPPPPIEEVERTLAEWARERGTPSDQSTSELIHAVFEFREKVARDLMVPRTEVLAIEVDTPVPEIMRLLAEEGHSRLPVYRENLDHVIGFLHARDIVPLMQHPELIVLRDLVRPPHFVPWSKPVDQLLREMQKRHIHIAMVVDEYGGVMGICTLEDVLEEIVGEIGDEFEEDERRGVEAHADGTYTIRADTPVAEFNRVAGGALPEDGQYETVGGFLNTLAGAIPASGDRFFFGGWLFTVSEATPRRALKVQAARVKRPAGA